MHRFMSHDFEYCKISSGRYRLKHDSMMQMVDNLYVFKHLLLQHMSVFKRMSECNTLTTKQGQTLRTFEDVKKCLSYQLNFEVEEVSKLEGKQMPASDNDGL